MLAPHEIEYERRRVDRLPGLASGHHTLCHLHVKPLDLDGQAHRSVLTHAAQPVAPQHHRAVVAAYQLDSRSCGDTLLRYDTSEKILPYRPSRRFPAQKRHHSSREDDCDDIELDALQDG